MLPLPNGRTCRYSRENGNQGLYYQKFFDQWLPDFSKVCEAYQEKLKENGKEKKTDYHGGKMNWVLAQSYSTNRLDGKFREDGSDRREARDVGNRDQIKGAIERQSALAEACNGRPETFVSISPFATGMGLPHAIENGFLFHHTLGVPYLPGSSIKGLMLAWAKQWEDGASIEAVGRLFGRDDEHLDGPGAGLIIVFDALPIGPVKLMAEVITPHTGGWRNAGRASEHPPADWVSPNPIPFLAVAPDTKFQFALGLRADGAEQDLKKAFDYLELALEWIGAGSKTAIGFGRFQKPALVQMQQMQMKAELREAEKAKPLGVGDRAVHDDWGTVEVREVLGADARVFSFDEQDTVTLPMSELRKKR